MDVTNRSAIITASIVWILLALFVILLAWTAPGESIDKLVRFSRFLSDHNNRGEQLVVTFGGLILVLLGLMVIILEVAPQRSGALKVTKVGSGAALIGTDEIGQRLQEELRTVPELLEFAATVTGRGRKAEVQLDLYVTADADLAAAAEEACHRARALVEGRMGVELASAPRAQVHYHEPRMARSGEALSRPAAASPASTLPSPYAPPSFNTGPAPRVPGASLSRSEASDEAAETPAEDRPGVS